MLIWMRRRLSVLKRAVPAVLGLVLVAQGIASLRKGEGGYTNYWGGLVFPPFAIVLGLALLVIAALWPDALSKRIKNKRGREVRFPHQDVRKW